MNNSDGTMYSYFAAAYRREPRDWYIRPFRRGRGAESAANREAQRSIHEEPEWSKAVLLCVPARDPKHANEVVARDGIAKYTRETYLRSTLAALDAARREP